MSISSLCLEIREEESCEHERYYVDVTKDCLHFSPLCLPLSQLQPFQVQHGYIGPYHIFPAVRRTKQRRWG